MVSKVPDEVKAVIKAEVSLAELRLRNWILAGLITNVIAWGPVIFYFGVMNQNIESMVKANEVTVSTMQKRGIWMQDQDKWNLGMQAWAESKGYKPPTAPAHGADK